MAVVCSHAKANTLGGGDLMADSDPSPSQSKLRRKIDHHASLRAVSDAAHTGPGSAGQEDSRQRR
jgi:hypothetical protein